MKRIRLNENTIRKCVRESIKRVIKEEEEQNPLNEQEVYNRLIEAMDDMQSILMTEYEDPSATDLCELMMNLENELQRFFSDEDTGKLKWNPVPNGYDALA